MKFVTTNEIQFIQEFPLISFVMKLELTNEIQEIIKNVRAELEPRLQQWQAHDLTIELRIQICLHIEYLQSPEGLEEREEGGGKTVRQYILIALV